MNNPLFGETGRQLGDRFREQLRDVEKDNTVNLQNHSKQQLAVCGLFLHQGSTESRKTLEQKFVFQRTLFIQLIYSVVFHVPCTNQ